MVEAYDGWWVDYLSVNMPTRQCEVVGCGSMCEPGLAIRVHSGPGAERGDEIQEAHYFCSKHKGEAEECRVRMRLLYPSENT